MGPCHCEACRTRFAARYRRPLPASDGDLVYRAFLAESAREVAARIGDEITVMSLPERDRTLVHLVNASGHADTAYFDAIEMRDVSIDLALDFTRARAAVSAETLAVTRSGGRGRFTPPRLEAYEVVVLERE
jgi:hypothetical protein